MINQAAIDEFLSRKVHNFDWMKGCSSQELDAAIAEYHPRPDFGVNLWLHQKVLFLILIELKRFMLHIDMGGGKTLSTLTLIKYRKQRGEHPRAIVFVPYITSVETWIEEVAKHAPDLTCVPLLGSGAANAVRLGGVGDLFVICYASAVAMVSETVKDRTGKTKWQLKAGQVREYFANFDMLIMDEIHKCKNVSSLTYRMCRAISAQCEYSMGLTGTPFGKDLTDLWPQYNLVDFGETLGPTLGFYRSVFFEEKLGYWGGRDYKFRKKLLPDLKRIIKNKSIYYGIDEFYDMPPKEYIARTIELPAAARGYVDVAMKAIREAVRSKGTGSYQLVESNYLQLRQLSSGFMTLKGENNDRLQVKFDDNPKLEVLTGIIESLPFGRKCVVFHHFVYTNHLLSDHLKSLKIKHARVWGRQRDPLGQLRKFREDPECTVLLLNTKSGSSSLNLQFASYIIFYEQPDSPIDRAQAESRVWRPGQENRVFIYDLITNGTVDKKLHNANMQGKFLLKEILSGQSEI